jgi:hypothetical protein
MVYFIEIHSYYSIDGRICRTSAPPPYSWHDSRLTTLLYLLSSYRTNVMLTGILEILVTRQLYAMINTTLLNQLPNTVYEFVFLSHSGQMAVRRINQIVCVHSNAVFGIQRFVCLYTHLVVFWKKV